MVQEQQDDSAEVMVAVEMVEQAQKQPPPWLTEAVVMLKAVREKGLLASIQQQVRVPRGRMGWFEVCDFVLVLLVYAVSQEKTLVRCYEALRPCQAVLAALWSRQRLPARATLSRFLRAMSAAAVETLRELMLSQVLTQGLEGEAVGGLVDRRGVRHVVFDVDGTHQVARQRALVAGEDYPPARRRLRPLCAPGYGGRKRGEVVRTRTTVQQAHSREWLGTWGNAGNGDPYGELDASCKAIVRYQKARGLAPNQALVRLDGLYGHARAAQVLQQQGVGFLLRVADYGLLREPAVQAALAQAPTARFVQPDTQTEREVFDVGWLLWRSADGQSQVRCRLLVTRRRWVQQKRPPIGQRHGEWALELFGTDRDPGGLSATDLLSLYFARGGFEQTLAEEDREQEPDRWCSGHPPGQEAWQLLSQGVWNLRLRLGYAAVAPPLRRTQWAPAEPPQEPTPPPCGDPALIPEPVLSAEAPPPRLTPFLPAPPPPPPPSESALPSPCGDPALRCGSVPTTGALPATPDALVRGASGTLMNTLSAAPQAALLPPPPYVPECPAAAPAQGAAAGQPGGRVAKAAGRGAGRFGGADFTWSQGQLFCPAGQRLHPMRRRGLRVFYQARQADCASCKLAPACLGTPTPTCVRRRGRQVTVHIDESSSPATPPSHSAAPPAPSPPPPPPPPPMPLGPYPLWWEDVPSSRLRASCHRGLLSHVVLLPPPPVPLPLPPGTRATRAHRRLTWPQRFARNAHPPLSAPWPIRLTGVPSGLSAFLATPRPPAQAAPS